MQKTLQLLAVIALLGAFLAPAHAATLKKQTVINSQEALSQERDDAPSDENPTVSKKSGPSSQFSIIAGDVLQITVWKEEGLDQEVLVLTDGSVNFPLIGSVQAQGLSPAELQDLIKEKLVKFIPDAAVSVSVKAALGHTVNVLGQVQKPGEILLGHGLTVMQALSQAGGLTAYANESRIIILHRENGKETKIRFPYDDVAHGDDLDKDIVLNPGDVVVVPTAGLL
jgi:polysaccharide export outer membrane protein